MVKNPGASLATMMKTVPWEILKPYMLTPEQLEKISGEKLISIEKFGLKNLDTNDQYTYNKFPILKPYFYVRELGGEMKLKVAMGTSGLKIIS